MEVKEEYMKDKRLKRGIILIAVAALFCFLIMNFNKAVSIISTIFTVISLIIQTFAFSQKRLSPSNPKKFFVAIKIT